jgi:hypothetical protein
MTRSLHRFSLRSTVLAAAFSITAGLGMGLGCVLYVEDTECGPFAYDYRGDCHCEVGYEGDDPYVEGCAPRMTFRLTDDCDDGSDVLWKLFSDAREWSWPSDDDVYRSPGYLYDDLRAITCEPDEWICFGAETEAGGLVYGVGLDFSAQCDDCCYPCESRELDLGYFTCN